MERRGSGLKALGDITFVLKAKMTKGFNHDRLSVLVARSSLISLGFTITNRSSYTASQID